MNASDLVAAFLAGFPLAAIYFGGLWYTVRCMPTMRQPAIWFVVSFALRMVVLLTGFYLVMGGRWERLVACAAGFLLSRALLLRSLGELGSASDRPLA